MKKMHLPAFNPATSVLLLFLFFINCPSFCSGLTTNAKTLTSCNVSAGDKNLKVVYHPETKELKVFISSADATEDMMLEVFDASQALVVEQGISELLTSGIITISTKDFAAGDYKVKLSGKNGAAVASFTVSK